MERSIENHLNSAELEWLVSSGVERMGGAPPPPDPTEVRRHIETCQRCRESLLDTEQAVDRLEALRQTGSNSYSTVCPPETVWPDIVFGQIDSVTSNTHLAHAAECEYCGTRLREATEDLLTELTAEEKEAVASLSCSTKQGQRELQVRLTAHSGPEPRVVEFTGGTRSKSLMFRWWIAAAVTLLAVIGLGSVLYLRYMNSPNVMLAAAYTERRTVEFRMPGGNYGPIRAERGSESEAPALLAARAKIAQELSKDPANVLWVEASARAALLAGRYREALDLAERTAQSRPDWPPALLDLGEAHFERAEAEGSVADYEVAIQRFSDLLERTPNDPVTLFNRALAYEKVLDFDRAQADWEHYLRIDSSSKWADEVRDRMDRARQQR